MKKFLVPNTFVSYNNSLFSPDRPFETSAAFKSSSQMRARRSPNLGSGAISISNHIRNREFYWFTNDWNLTVNNNTSSTVSGIIVQITANHVGGKAISRNTSIQSIGVNGTIPDSFSPLDIISSSMIMDSSTNPNLNFQVNYFNGGSSADIFFDWGGFFPEFSFGQPVLTTPPRTLSTWGTNGGVNVTVNLLDEAQNGGFI